MYTGTQEMDFWRNISEISDMFTYRPWFVDKIDIFLYILMKLRPNFKQSPKMIWQLHIAYIMCCVGCGTSLVKDGQIDAILPPLPKLFWHKHHYS